MARQNYRNTNDLTLPSATIQQLREISADRKANGDLSRSQIEVVIQLISAESKKIKRYK